MSSGSSICTLELQPIAVPAQAATIRGSQPILGNSLNQTSDQDDVDRVLGELGGSDNDPEPRAERAQRWNESKLTMYKVFSSCFCFFVTGANDAAYGPLIPYLMRYYSISHTIVSLVFLSPFIGYVASALLNNHLHLKFGQRGIAILCSSAHLTAYTIIACHPPYPVLIFAFILAGFGNGTADAAWNAWVGNFARSSEVLGFLHACYGVGGVVAPLVASAMIAKVGLPWFNYYYFMIGIAVVEGLMMISAFWKSTGATYRQQYRINELEKETALWDALTRLPTARVAWTCAVFLLGYVGIEVALGGWIVLFMIDVRDGDEFSSGMSAMGFWLGITVGRVVLGFVTARVGIKLATSVYIAATTALQLVLWLVPQFYVSAIAVAFQGFFLGPLFPSVVLFASKILPRHQHVVVIGFASAFGGCGAAILPFVTGLLANAKGVQVLQPIILALLVTILAIWLCLPRLNKKRE
ncbi:putative MFS transporter [Sarocladium strictum]